jgi:ABC-type sugar transport system permease subunit
MWIALLLFRIIMGYSGSILLYLNAISQIPTSVFEAAKIDGANELHTFFHVVIPGAWGTIVSLFCVSLAGMVSNQAYLFSLFGSSAPPFIRTMGYHMFLIINPETPDYTQYPYASALGVLLTLIIAPLTICLRKLLTAYGPRED